MLMSGHWNGKDQTAKKYFRNVAKFSYLWTIETIFTKKLRTK